VTRRCKTQGETDPPELLHLAFQLYDEEENNLLSLDNLIKITKEIGEETPVETLQDMINEAAGVKPGDPDATFITEEQFLKILVKQTETPA
jgi:Ca2+-binding EF-hand superfamily protein